MNDAGTDIDILLETVEIQSDLELKTNGRILLGYVFALYDVDQDLSLTIYVKRDNDMEWEALEAITFDKDEKRLFRPLPIGLSVIDYKVKLSGTVGSAEIYSLKVFQKTLPVGKFG